MVTTKPRKRRRSGAELQTSYKSQYVGLGREQNVCLCYNRKIWVILVVFCLCFVVFCVQNAEQIVSDLNTLRKAAELPIKNHRLKDELSAIKRKTIKTNNKVKEMSSPVADICPNIEPITSTVTINGREVKLTKVYGSIENAIKIYQADEFLSPEECDGLSRAHLRAIERFDKTGPIFCFANTDTFQKYLQEIGISTKISSRDFIPETSCVNESFSFKLQNKLKYSYSTAFYPGESQFSATLEERIKQVCGLVPSFGGKFQITSYPVGIGYKQHTDCNIDSSELRDRYATVLIYLQNVHDGGETVFPSLNVKIKPKKGRMIFWINMNRSGKCEPKSVHESAQVKKGKKYILQRWYYYQSFQALGNRPQEPETPTRKPHQPRVSCDLYEEGSCRWYDEWGYDHLDEYNMIKKELQ